MRKAMPVRNADAAFVLDEITDRLEIAAELRPLPARTI